MGPLPHHSLIAWQRADDLFVRLHKLSRDHLPIEERYELGSQLRRAAYSVPANIVEAFARQHTRERLQFLHTSFASLAEVGYCLHVARRLGYISVTFYEELELQVRQVGAPLHGLIARQRRSVY